MRSMRVRRRIGGMREIRLTVPDARSNAVRRRVGAAVAALNSAAEQDAQAWLETVSEFDTTEAARRDGDAAR
jgi:hypothetical protein